MQKTESITQVAFARSISPDKQREWSQVKRGIGKALEPLEM
jgi:hypothetical protein